MANYSVNINIPAAVLEQSVIPYLTLKGRIKISSSEGVKRMPLKVTLFRTERCEYLRFIIGDERWTVELGDMPDDIEIKEYHKMMIYNHDDTVNKVSMTFQFSDLSKRDNSRVDNLAKEQGLTPYIFTLGDGFVTKKGTNRKRPVKFGPSSNKVINLTD